MSDKNNATTPKVEDVKVKTEAVKTEAVKVEAQAETLQPVETAKK